MIYVGSWLWDPYVGSILFFFFLLKRKSFVHDVAFSLCILLPLTMFPSGVSQALSGTCQCHVPLDIGVMV